MEKLSTDEKFMQKALALAAKGLGKVEPNPAVGAVIVKDGTIIGKGYHKKFGGPHAEINAIEDCRKKSGSAAGATLYVTLEPCCHHGKTGPCVDAVIAAGFARVVIAATDPTEKVAGKSIEKLRQAGIETTVGVCESQAVILNAPFYTFALTGKPWVTLKWAQSIDGFLTYKDQNERHRWISNPQSRKDVQQLRRRCQAITVGINTVIADDPLLLPRPAGGKKPLRVVLDRQLRTPIESQFIQTAKKSPVLIIAGQAAVETEIEKVKLLQGRGIEIAVDPQPSTVLNLHYMIDVLAQRDVQHVLIEPGPKLIDAFINAGLADELIVYIAPKILGEQGAARIGNEIKTIIEAQPFIRTQSFDTDMKFQIINTGCLPLSTHEKR